MLVNPLSDAEREFEEQELWSQLMAGPQEQGEPVYRLADQPTKAIVQEEIHLLDRLHRGLEERIGSELEGEERQARIHELLEEDEELAAIAERLDRLSQSHDESVMLGLARLAEEEERAEGEGWSL
ncbi:MAG: hypothetical protein ACTHK3_02785 [Solirubrobacterales bacterium]